MNHRDLVLPPTAFLERLVIIPRNCSFVKRCPNHQAKNVSLIEISALGFGAEIGSNVLPQSQPQAFQ
jgi:hypothetical protein